jgi:extradiol dioxygenase family protein
MKIKAYCPACGNRDTKNLVITTFKGKRLSLHLSSHADIRRSSGQVCCVICKHVGHLSDFQKLLDKFDE